MSVEISDFEVLISPATVDAGAQMTLSARLATEPPRDLRGCSVEIRNADGICVGTLPVTSFDGALNITSQFCAAAPERPGAYEWRAVLSVSDDDGDGETSVGPDVPFQVEVGTHSTLLGVWGVPPAIEAGRSFSIQIGAKCSSGCNLEGQTFRVRDHDGEEVARGAFSGETLPGSEGLYVAQVDMTSPRAEGRHDWTVAVDPPDLSYPHEGAATTFRVTSVAPADCIVRIEAVDIEKQHPLANMSVVMHPYRARTDEDGLAELRVTRGDYTVFISGRGYYPVKRVLQVAADLTATAPLEAEPPQSGDW